jgi:HAE1 family hydrophobic/amphiphilic exporter-1/multidrug efflux pump
MVQKVVTTVKENPNIENAVAFTGMDFIGGGVFRNNAATIFFTMKHWDERKVPAQALVGEFFGRTGGFKEGLAIAFNAPPIFALGATGGFELHLQSRGEGGAKRLAEVAQMFIMRASQEPGIAQAQMFWRPNVPQLFVDVDREKAKALGVPIDEVFNALAATLGTYYVNDFNKYGRTWQVLMSSEARFRKRPDDVGSIYVRSDKGEMVPVRSIANIQYVSGPDTLERFNNLPAVTVLGSGAPGVSTGQALEKIEKVAHEVLPSDFTFDWSGASLQEKRSGGTSIVALVAGAFMAFLILAAQYERWSLPLSVMLALPFGTFGALAAIWINNLVFTHLGRSPLTNDVYFQIGLVTLLGLAAKNAILIVEFALLKTQEGLSVSAASVEAARLRFRPILMTSLAFILGVSPLVFSSGAGAGARHSVGTGVMGGMLAATFLAIFFVPFFFKLIMSRKFGEARSSEELKREATHHREMVANPPHHEVTRSTPRTEGSL